MSRFLILEAIILIVRSTLHFWGKGAKQWQRVNHSLSMELWRSFLCADSHSWKSFAKSWILMEVRGWEFWFTWNFERFMEVRTADATFSSVSLALDDVRCHWPELFLACFWPPDDFVSLLLVVHQSFSYALDQTGLPWFVGRFCRGTPILAGGIGIARFWWFGLVLVFVLFLGQFLSQCALLFTRLGLMPCSAWSKKNPFQWSPKKRSTMLEQTRILDYSRYVGLV